MINVFDNKKRCGCNAVNRNLSKTMYCLVY